MSYGGYRRDDDFSNKRGRYDNPDMGMGGQMGMGQMYAAAASQMMGGRAALTF